MEFKSPIHWKDPNISCNICDYKSFNEKTLISLFHDTYYMYICMLCGNIMMFVNQLEKTNLNDQS